MSDVGAAITAAMQDQLDRDLVRLVVGEFVASGLRMAARLEDAGPEWADLAAYHNETMRQFGIEP